MVWSPVVEFSELRGGAFSETPFSHVLVRLFDARATGGLTITPPGEEAQLVALDRGLPTRVVVADGYGRLGELLAERGVVMGAEVSLALDAPGLVGEGLVRPAAITAETLERGLVLQLFVRLERIFSLPPATEWAFATDASSFDHLPAGVRVDVPRVLWRGISRHGEREEVMEAVFDRLGYGPLALRPEGRIERFGFDAAATALVERIAVEGPPLPLLLAATEDERTRRIVYVLALSRFLEAREPMATSGDTEAALEDPYLDADYRMSIPAGAPPPAVDILPPASSTNAATQVTTAPLDRAPLEPRPLSECAAPTSARSSSPSQRVEPAPSRADVAAGDEAAPPARSSAKQLGRVNLARVPRSRAWQDRATPLEARDDAPDSRTSPDDLHEHALYELWAGRPAEALVLCERAHSLRPEDLEIQASRAWIRAHQKRPDLRVIALDLDDLLLQDAEHVDARFYRGMVRHKLGSDAGARSDFERVLALDPEHRAARAQLERR